MTEYVLSCKKQNKLRNKQNKHINNYMHERVSIFNLNLYVLVSSLSCETFIHIPDFHHHLTLKRLKVNNLYLKIKN